MSAMTKISFLVLVLAIFCQTKLVLSVAPLHGGGVFPRFQEFPDEVTENGQQGLHTDIDSLASRFRLPNQIVPRHYKLEIRPILNEREAERFTAPGKVQITVECLQATNNLVLHADNLTINTNSIRVFETENPSNVLTVERTSSQPENETFTMEVSSILSVGTKYDILIEYVARMPFPEERMNGIYLSSYWVGENERYLATTQFSRTRAFRKTLPSFDEPSQKATFEISIGRQDPYHTLSNMDIRVSENITGMPGWYWDRYNPTPVMPPTIIAMIVSDFINETAEASLFPGRTASIWGPPPLMVNGAAAFAAQAAARTLKYFEDYFEIDYELPKIDSAAIPDFAAGAMENWGLNTYRTIYLIWSEGINTAAEKFRCANIIGHELAHQYWGNLVTHAWWNDWWLTEGFASYFEYLSVEHIHPEFEAFNRIITSDVQPAMAFDAARGTVPIHGNVTWDFVENPSTINYNKGAALVRMMQAFLSEDVFRKSHNFYLRKRSYEAVHQDALFDDLTEYLVENNIELPGGKTMKEIMDTWTLKSGFPLIRVSQAGASRIFISQERFKNRDNTEEYDDSDGLWQVPFAYVTQSNPQFNEQNRMPKFWIDKNVILTNHAVDTNQWIVVNPDGRSYYRVLYDAHFSNLLKTQLDTDINSIAIGSRSMIVDDYFTFAYQGYTTITNALSMTTFIANETDFNVWAPFLKHLRKPFEMLSADSAQFNVFKAYILKSMGTVFDLIGFEQKADERSILTLLRAQLFDWACSLGSEGCSEEAKRLLDLWAASPANDPNPVPVDIRQYIYCAGAQLQTHFDFLDTKYLATNDTLIRNALACSSNTTILESLLTRALSEDNIPIVDALPFIQRVVMNSDGRPLVIKFIEDRFLDLVASERIGIAGFVTILNDLSYYVRSSDESNKLQAVVNANQELLEGSMANINASFTRITANVEWMAQFGNGIVTWLNANTV